LRFALTQQRRGDVALQGASSPEIVRLDRHGVVG
jgi:hypothetical protein